MMPISSVVDIVDYSAANSPERFADALHRTGFVMLTNHAFSSADIASIYREWATWFGSATKYTEINRQSEAPVPTLAGRPEREFFHITHERRSPPSVSNSAVSYFDNALILATRLLSWLAFHEVPCRPALALPDMLNGASRTRLRIQYYHPVPNALDSGAMRAVPHADHNLISMLPAPTGPGLEVRDSGGSWHSVTYSDGAVLVMAGSMLELTSSGYYPSGYHRVVVPQGEAAGGERLALIMLVQPGDDVVLKGGECTAGEFISRMAGCTGFDEHRIL